MITKHDGMTNFIPTCEHYDACDKMCMAWSNYVHKLSTPDKFGNTYFTDDTTYGYLDYIVQNARHPWLGTARIIEMTPQKRAVLANMSPPPPPKPTPRSSKPYVYPKQHGTKLHDDRSIRKMFCVTCGMDFYDHHDIGSRVAIYCPWCESGHVSETDTQSKNKHVLRTRYTQRMYIITDENGNIIK